MKRPRITLALAALASNWLLVSPAEAQLGTSAPSLTRADTGFTLTGTVINSVTGEPVGKALVRLSAPVAISATEDSTPPEERYALTDRGGRFRFAGLTAVRAAVSALKPGYFGLRELRELRENGSVTGEPEEVRAQRPSTQETTVEVGANSPEVLLKLVPEAVISGRVTGSMGNPVDGVTIKLSSLRISNGRPHLQTVGQESEQTLNLNSNEDGEFRIAGLLPGNYYVAAIPPARAIQTQDGRLSYAITYYPGAADLSQAAPIRLSAGQEARIDFTLRPVPIVSIAGQVTGFPHGQQVDLQFTNQSGDSLSLDKRFDPQTGAFQAHVAAGSMFVIKAALDAPTHPVIAELVHGASDDLNVRLALSPAPSIPVVVHPETNGQAGPVSASVTLHPTEIGRPSVVAAETDGPEPTFLLHNVVSGSYKVEAAPGNPTWYVKSVNCAGVDLLQKELTVTPGQYAPIEIVLSNDAASLSGTVQYGNPEGAASVLVIPESAPLNPRTVAADSSGEFQMDGLGPGAYKIFAFDRLDGLEYTNPDALREYASKAVQASLQASGKATVRLNLISRGE